MKKVTLIFCVLFGFLLNDNLIAEDIIIGTQKWMPRNLDVTHYRNGAPIRHAVTAEEWIDAGNKKEGAWCYYNNDPLIGAIYGKLYNWYAVNDTEHGGIAQSGYHVASDAEWTTLGNYLGGYEIAGGKLKETDTTHWTSPNTGATNSSGFTALPGGNRSYAGFFYSLNLSGVWWSASENEETKAWLRGLTYNVTSIGIDYYFKLMGFSVRCIKGESVVVTNPQLTISKTKISINNILNIKGSFYTPNFIVNIHISNDNGTWQISTLTDENGDFDYDYTIPITFKNGIYNMMCEDEFSRIYSITKQFIVEGQNLYEDIKIESPTSDFGLYSGDEMIVRFKDKIIADEYHKKDKGLCPYKYDLHISYDNGQQWDYVKSFDFKSVETKEAIPLYFKFIVTNYSNTARIKVTDSYNPIRYSTSEPFLIVAKPASDLSTKLVWDNSIEHSDAKNNTILGVAADGTSRLLIVLNKDNPNKVIKKVELKLKDSKGNTKTHILGTVKAVTNNSEPLTYTEEANNATESTIEQNIPGLDEYWFWYVAPRDFFSNSDDVNWGTRTVRASFLVTYMDNITEYIDQIIWVARPPLVFVHGLNSDGKIWNNFSFGNEMFLNNRRWMSVSNPDLYYSNPERNSLAQHAFLLQQSISLSLLELRKNGFAVNRADFVCHSMGGLIVREFEKNSQFYSGFGQNGDFFRNYNQGFVNKLITINTPHNGSPWANLINNFVTDINEVNSTLNPFDWFKDNFIKILGTSSIEKLTSKYPDLKSLVYTETLPRFGFDEKTAKTTLDLVDMQEKIQGEETGKYYDILKLNSHTIATDWLPGLESEAGNHDSYFWQDLKAVGNLFDFWDRYIKIFCLINKSSVNFPGISVPCACVDGLEKIYKVTNTFASIYAGLDFLYDSDIIVRTSSQTAGLLNNDRRVTVFDNLIHTSMPDYIPIVNNYNSVLNSTEVGMKVFDLLNESLIDDDSFGLLPSTDFYVRPPLTNKIDFQKPEQQDSTLAQFEIEPILTVFSPLDSSIYYVDSTITIEFSLSSKIGLKQYSIYCLDNIINDSLKSDILSYKFQVDGYKQGNQTISVIAIFEYSDTTIVLAKHINIEIRNSENPIQLISVPNVLLMKVNEYKEVKIKALYNNTISQLNITNDVSIFYSDSSKIIFNSENELFKAKDTGFAFIVITYKNISDTLYFYINGFLPIPDNPAILVYPYKYQQNINRLDSLKWNLPENAVISRVQVSNDSTMEFPFINIEILNDTSFNIGNIDNSATYYWRVKAIGLGGESDWSETWSFTTESDKHQIPLSSGWNLISSYIEPDNSSIPVVWDEVKDNIVIVKNNAGATYIPAFDIDDIKNWKSSEGYQVYASQADTLVVTGLQIVPENTPINLNAGWNIISYLRNSELDCETAFATITDNGNLIIVKDNFGNTYIPAYYINSIGYLIPGQGYQIYVLNPDELIYPEN